MPDQDLDIALDAIVSDPSDEAPKEELVTAEPEFVELDEAGGHGDLYAADAEATEEEPEAAEVSPEPAPAPAWTPPTQEEWNATVQARDGLHHQVTNLREDRRHLQAMQEKLEARLKPIEESSKAQIDAQEALREESEKPTDPAELFQYNMLKKLTATLDERLKPVEEAVKPLHAAYETNQQAAERQRQEQDFLHQQEQRIQLEDSRLTAEQWNEVQAVEIARAKYYASPEGGGMPVEAARRQAAVDRWATYLHSYALEQQGQLPPGHAGPATYLREARKWGFNLSLNNGNNGGGPVPSQPSAAVTNHRQLQRETPPPATPGSPPDTSNPLAALAREVREGRIEGEALTESIEDVTAFFQKTNPRVTTNTVFKKLLTMVEAL